MEWIEMASRCPVMRGVPAADLERIFEILPYQVRNYRKNEMMASQGEVVSKLVILLNGSARGEMMHADGRMVKIEDVEAPRPIAAAFLFGKENRYPVDVIANEPVRALVIFKEDFIRLLRLNETIMMNYISLVSSKAQFLSNKIKFLTFKTIKEKLANYLISLGARQGETIEIPVHQRELADLFGVARPSVARGLADLERDGIIEVRNRKVRILKLSALTGLTV